MSTKRFMKMLYEVKLEGTLPRLNNLATFALTCCIHLTVLLTALFLFTTLGCLCVRLVLVAEEGLR